MRHIFLNIRVIFLLLINILLLPSGLSASDNKLTIFYASNLTSVMNELGQEFNKLYPDIELAAESSGSILAIKKVTELNRPADMIFVADYKLIDKMLTPKYTNWGVAFYKDRLVIAFTEKSRYTNEIDSKNWFRILMRPDVKYGYANPNLAPVGYNTLIAWELADLYYNEKINNKTIYEALKEKCPEDYVRPDVSELIPTLESMSLDYLFLYQSTAEQHNLKFIQLPEEIDLGNEKLEEQYRKANITLTDQKGTKQIIFGKPIVFAFTLLNDAPNKKAAFDFAKLLLSEKGQLIMKRNFQPEIVPAIAINKENIPEELRALCQK
ncbi:MAG: tungstate ABC transporter substrate-binding protein WtpA [Candidatus Omnitrophota bacterium]|nr:tungstate ABC transporter substrate-binding protein WtpA [Candidatus Omnitrophota bacterium]